MSIPRNGLRIINSKRCSRAYSLGIKLIISIEEMQYILKIIVSFECSGILIKGAVRTIQNKIKEQISDPLSSYFR